MWKKLTISWKPLAIGLGSALLIFILVFCTVPVKDVPYTVTERYQAAETYYVSEPYTVQEPYTVKEPCTAEEPYTYFIDKSSTLFSGSSYRISPRSFYTTSKYIDVSGKANYRVAGNVRAISGGEFIFKVYNARILNSLLNVKGDDSRWMS